MNPGDEIISVTPQEYTIDGEPGVMQPKGMMGSKIEANFPYYYRANYSRQEHLQVCY